MQIGPDLESINTNETPYQAQTNPIEPEPVQNKPVSHSVFSLPDKEVLKTVFKKFLPLIANYMILFSTRNFAFYYIKPYNDSLLEASYGVASAFLCILSIACIVSMNIGLVPRLSQAYGAKDYKLMGFYLHRGIINNLFIMIPCTILMIFSYHLLLLLDYSEELAHNIRNYLVQCILGSYMLILSQAISVYFNACGDFNTPTIVQIMGTLIYIICCKIFIGNYHLGLQGCTIAFNINQIFLVIGLYICVKLKKPAPGSFFLPQKKSFQCLWDLMKAQVRVGSVVFVEWSGATIIDMMSGALGTQQAAAYAILIGLCSFYYSLPVATGDVVMATIGNYMGEGKVDKAKEVQKISIQMTFIFSILVVAVIEIFKDDVLNLVTSDPDLIDITKSLISIWVFYSMLDGIAMVIGSVLRSVGNEKVAMRVQFVSMYLIAIPLGFVLAFKFGFKSKGLLFGFTACSYLTFACYIFIILKLNWEKEAEKIKKKLIEDGKEANLDENKKLLNETDAESLKESAVHK